MRPQWDEKRYTRRPLVVCPRFGAVTSAFWTVQHPYTAGYRCPALLVLPPGEARDGSHPGPEKPGREASGIAIPAYGYPEAAAAVVRAARYGAWRAAPSGVIPELADIRTEDARTLVREFFRSDGHWGWLPPDTTAALLRCYGIPLAELVPVHSEDDAVSAFAAGGGVPVVLKADVPGLVHRGNPPADLDALRDLLLRVSRLADDLPEITDLDLNPVIARPDGYSS